jgi:hypothetical protein
LALVVLVEQVAHVEQAVRVRRVEKLDEPVEHFVPQFVKEIYTFVKAF